MNTSDYTEFQIATHNPANVHNPADYIEIERYTRKTIDYDGNPVTEFIKVIGGIVTEAHGYASGDITANADTPAEELIGLPTWGLKLRENGFRKRASMYQHIVTGKIRHWL